jgi:hypothetical protein
MHTKDKLAAALRDIGQSDMADRAAMGYWHDFLSPLTAPTTPEGRRAAKVIRDYHNYMRKTRH